VETVKLDLRDPGTFAGAVQGCSALFLLRRPAIADTKHTLNPFIDAARAGGIGPVVFLSVAGAEKNRIVPHHAGRSAPHRPRGRFHAAPARLLRAELRRCLPPRLAEDDRIFVPQEKGS